MQVSGQKSLPKCANNRSSFASCLDLSNSLENGWPRSRENNDVGLSKFYELDRASIREDSRYLIDQAFGDVLLGGLRPSKEAVPDFRFRHRIHTTSASVKQCIALVLLAGWYSRLSDGGRWSSTERGLGRQVS